METAGKERVGIERVALKDTYYHMQNRQLVESCCITQEAQLVLCDNLEGWFGMGSGREIQEGGDICMIMADAHHCVVETNTTL